MAPNKDIEMAYLISRSKVAGAGRYQIDRPLGEHISFEKAVEILLHIFHELLSKYGYTVRIEQIELARHI
jgi:ATP-dependent DNA helicase DinG